MTKGLTAVQMTMAAQAWARTGITASDMAARMRGKSVVAFPALPPRTRGLTGWIVIDELAHEALPGAAPSTGR